MNPRLAMRQEDLPQQKLYAVRELPPKPPGFQVACPLYGGGEMEPNIAPEKAPSSARYLGMAEWAWGPMHDRAQAYYLSTNRRRSHWLLWVKSLDENDTPWKWVDAVYAYGPKKGVPEKVAAVHLLREAWRDEKEHTRGFDRYHFLGGTGLLDVADFGAIACEVWGPEPEGEEKTDALREP